jgi:protein-tyrosine-phosphatase/predicted ATP-grasp superfamily ATP-dependent carboligase
MAEPRGNVLVLGDNDLAGLATVRSLGRARVAVHLVAFEPAPIARRSRHVRRAHHLGHPLREPDQFTDRLLHLLRRTPFDLVIPTSDKALVPLLPRRDEVETLARFVAPDHAGFLATHHKDQTLRLAERLGIAVPPTQVLHNVADMARLQRPFTFPLVLKPSRSVTPRTLIRNTVVIVRSEEELFQRLPALLERCPVLVQQFCPGHGVGLTILARRGEVVAAFQHRRVHEPPEGGASSYRQSVPLSSDLLDAARRVCAELRWTGPAMLEFKVDPDTGRAVLMEINGRLWGSLALAIQAGVDFPRLLYDLYVHDRVTPTFSYRTPYFVRHTTRDLYWLRANWQTPAGRKDLLKRSPAELLREIGNVVLGREGYDLESLSDPLPAVFGWLDFTAEIARGLRRRLHDWWYERRTRQLWAAVRAAKPALLQRLRQARSVLFVCLGNINRSAVAEKHLAALLAGTGRPIRVASAGLLRASGRTTGPVSLSVARELGIDLAEHRSQELTVELLDQFDLIVPMEPAHVAALARLHPPAMRKVVPLPAFQKESCVITIADPEGADKATFAQTYRTIVNCVSHLAASLTDDGPCSVRPPRPEAAFR